MKKNRKHLLSKTLLKKNWLNRISNNKGITLIALVVTIIVLLILAAISINMIMGENGIIKKAQDATNEMDEAQNSELEGMNQLSQWLDSKVNKTSDQEEKILITDASLKATDRTTTNSPTVKAKDEKGNQVVVPGEFKIANDSGNTVQQGIVIEDKKGNQFVWIPVSNINGDGSNPIIITNDKGEETGVEITLGRYIFKREKNATTNLYEDGTPTLIQKGSEYDQTTIANVADETVDTKYGVDDCYYELSDSRTAKESYGADGTNTTAKNLADFIAKTNTNKGFYIARYEASYGGTDSEGNHIPLSKVSTNATIKAWGKSNSYIGTVWNYIAQPEAAIVSQNMYKNNSYVESDLINSYAWDTAIVYIQAMGNTNYANATNGTNSTLMNTGKTGDQKCKIFDMSGNTNEWTTEYSSFMNSLLRTFPCTIRGGYDNPSCICTSDRKLKSVTYYDRVSFRVLLYVR